MPRTTLNIKLQESLTFVLRPPILPSWLIVHQSLQMTRLLSIFHDRSVLSPWAKNTVCAPGFTQACMTGLCLGGRNPHSILETWLFLPSKHDCVEIRYERCNLCWQSYWNVMWFFISDSWLQPAFLLWQISSLSLMRLW